jgi:hypothetical protein
MTLPLDTLRAYLGLPPWHFWQFADGPGNNAIVPIDSKCSTLTFEYDWQGSDAAGRASIRESIAIAEQLLTEYLGYHPAPVYGSDTVPWPRAYAANLTRARDLDATGRRVAVLGPGYVQALGVMQETLVGAATVAGGELVYSAQFNPALQDTFTITLPTTVTDPAQIVVYFAAADRFDGMDFSTANGPRWEITPVQVSITGGNVVIVGRKWLVGRPILYENPIAAAFDPQTAGNFATSLEVWQRTTNSGGTSVDNCQATLIYETNDCGACWGRCCCGGTVSSDPATTGLVIARAGIRDATLGLVTPAAAVYDPDLGVWRSQWCCAGSYCDPDRVTLRTLSGYPLRNGQMDPRMRTIMCLLSAAEMKRRICACRESNERLHDLQQDLTLESTETERYAVPTEQLNNPFGTRRGHVRAWQAARDYILRRGIAA